MEEDPEYKGGWLQRSIERSFYFRGGPRGWDAYTLALGLTLDDFQDKHVLDLGAGKEVQLLKDVAATSLNTRMIEMSPDFIYPDIRQTAKTSASFADLLIGLGQSLPFENESFDRVLTMHVLEHINTAANYIGLFRETVRVLKPGGKAYFGPIFSNMRDFLHKSKELNKMVSINSIKLLTGEIPEEYGREALYDNNGMKYGYTMLSRIILEKGGSPVPANDR